MARLSTLLAAGLLGGVLAFPVPGLASTLRQTAPEVTLQLVSQSAWNGVDHPLELEFEATNALGTALDQLSVELSVEAPARSRSLYELSLASDATPPILAFPFPQRGTLRPAQTRTFRIGPLSLQDLEARGETALYPLKVELRSRDLPVATLRTPMVYLIERPQVPLNLAWTWVLSEPLQYRPGGTFVPGTIEADIAKGGRLLVMANALLRLSSKQVDVVVSSVLIDQLQRMADGYGIADPGGAIRTVPQGSGGAADAAALLRILRDIAAHERTELLSTPFADPSLPALYRAGLATELPGLAERGREMLAVALGREPTRDVVRPYESQLDPATLPRLAQMGARTVLVDSNFVHAAKFASPPVTKLTAGGSSVAAIVPNPELAALAGAHRDDPYLAAHVALGELAAIWLELPGTPGRGAAVLFGEDPAIPARFLHPFADLVRRSQWLHPINATGFVSIIPVVAEQEVPPRTYPRFPPDYVNELLHTRASLGRFKQTAEGGAAAAGDLPRDLQLAAAGSLVPNPAIGRSFIRTVQNRIRLTYDRVRIDTSGVTLTSQGGQIPLVLANGSGQNLRVTLRFVTDRRLEFVDGAIRQVILRPGSRTLTVRVRARTTGRIPVRVKVLSLGNDPDLIAERTMVLRSTAYNRVALFMTIGAALFLLGWWGRRLLPRRKS